MVERSNTSLRDSADLDLDCNDNDSEPGRTLSGTLIELLDPDPDLADFLRGFENRYGSRELRALINNALNENTLDLRPDSDITPDPS